MSGLQVVCRLSCHGFFMTGKAIVLNPATKSGLTKVTKRWVAHVVQQAGHLNQIGKCGINARQAHLYVGVSVLELIKYGFGQVSAGLLYFQRMSQTASYRGVGLQGIDLRLLLQPAQGGGLDDPPPVTFGFCDQVSGLPCWLRAGAG